MPEEVQHFQRPLFSLSVGEVGTEFVSTNLFEFVYRIAAQAHAQRLRWAVMIWGGGAFSPRWQVPPPFAPSCSPYADLYVLNFRPLPSRRRVSSRSAGSHSGLSLRPRYPRRDH